MHHLRLLVATTLAVTLVAASPAEAQVRSTVDGTGDVWLINDDNSYTLVEGARVNVDVVRSTVRHSARRVTAKVRYRDLVRNQDTTTASFRILTSGKRTYLLQLSAGPGNRTGRVVFERYARDGLVPVRCAGVRRSVQYVRNRLVVSVPRHCLKRPRWVRYTGEATAIEEGPGASYSDALLSGDPVNDLFSPRIKRR